MAKLIFKPTMIRAMRYNAGVSLIELLLILTIISAVLFTLVGYQARKGEQLRSDRVVLQMKDILNAAMSYYVTNGEWPLTNPDTCTGTEGLSRLQNVEYLPPGTINNPWGNPFTVSCDSATSVFTVSTNTPSVKEASIAAGRMPLSSVVTPAGASCALPYDADCTTVRAGVTVPGQNLMNAREVNFASVYHSGACVPAPFCPPDMTPTIMVVPVAMSGMNNNPCSDPNDPATCNNAPVTPISSYTATAYPTGSPKQISSTTDTIRSCGSAAASATCYAHIGTSTFGAVRPGRYWRVCLYISTRNGAVTPTVSSWGQVSGTVMAITRCEPQSEPKGSSFDVWQ